MILVLLDSSYCIMSFPTDSAHQSCTPGSRDQPSSTPGTCLTCLHLYPRAYNQCATLPPRNTSPWGGPHVPNPRPTHPSNAWHTTTHTPGHKTVSRFLWVGKIIHFSPTRGRTLILVMLIMCDCLGHPPTRVGFEIHCLVVVPHSSH